MKRVFLFVVIGVLLINFISSDSLTSSTITGSATADDQENTGSNKDKNQTSTINSEVKTEAQEKSKSNDSETSSQKNQSKKKMLTREEIKKVIKEKNKLKIAAQTGECPESCTCAGSVIKCQLQNGREMTVHAGKSGNIILQVKEENVSTKVQLYKEEGRLYGAFKGNQTREIKMMPDKILDKIKEKMKARLQNESVELDEEGNYQVQAKKKARLFGMFPLKERVRVEINAETGEIIKTKTSWWGFLARDIKEDNADDNCESTTQEQDACCQNKGYDYWNKEKSECLFEASSEG